MASEFIDAAENEPTAYVPFITIALLLLLSSPAVFRWTAVRVHAAHKRLAVRPRFDVSLAKLAQWLLNPSEKWLRVDPPGFESHT